MIQNLEDNMDMIAQDIKTLKPNQKQFKQFNRELFKKYISKFSSKDKLHAINELIIELGNDQEYDFNFAIAIINDACETYKRI